MAGGLLYKNSIKINDYISVKNPTVGEILPNESAYYDTALLLTATPSDLMVQLDDAGRDFTTVDEWHLFCMLFDELKERDTSLFFEGITLSEFKPAINTKTGEEVLWNEDKDIIIDSLLHEQMCDTLRKILRFEKHTVIPGNDEYKEYIIKRTRKKQQRARRTAENAEFSLLEHSIISLVNTAEFPYNYESVLGLNIYQFNTSLQQIVKKIRFDKLMIGCYAGTVNMKEINQAELTWLSN